MKMLETLWSCLWDGRMADPLHITTGRIVLDTAI